MTTTNDCGKKRTATTTDASSGSQESATAIPEDAVLRREGRDCTFFYRNQNGTLVERAVFDDGEIGAVYQAGGDIDPESEDVDVLEADAWPTRDDDLEMGAPVLVADGAGAAAVGGSAGNSHDLPSWEDLTRFQLDALRAIEESDKPPKGLAVKARLEELYDREVNHGRLYPNLNGLVEDGFIAKTERDKRTNNYSLTSRGQALLDQRREWFSNGGSA